MMLVAIQAVFVAGLMIGRTPLGGMVPLVLTKTVTRAGGGGGELGAQDRPEADLLALHVAAGRDVGVGFVLVLGALTFFPALALAPILDLPDGAC